ncbi:hypothetical protein D6833_06595 [Candidatus Parcubacteria bacterium]|nr:MAG: hypothetical protein D6833_06595 [Candidatus Parcubacteria bacterium]
MQTMTFQQIVRYGLPGGIAIMVLFSVYQPSAAQFDLNAVGGAAVVSGIAIVVGALIYTLHRATAYPVIYRLLLLVPSLRLDKGSKVSRNVFWPSEQEVARDFSRWNAKREKASPVHYMDEWAAQVHYLYCSAWAVLVGHLIGSQLDWRIRPTPCTLSLLVFLLCLAAGFYHHVRYLYFERKLLKKHEQGSSSNNG